MTQIIQKTTTAKTAKITIMLKGGQTKSFNLKNQKQLRDCINWLNSESDYLPLVAEYGDDALKASYRLTAASQKMANESRQYAAYLRSEAGQRATNALDHAMVSDSGFMPVLGDSAMGYR